VKWYKEWGKDEKVLLVAKAKGMDPIGLKNKPVVPWYYEVFLKHYLILSNSRSYRLDVVPNSSTGFSYVTKPNPIDIPTILQYNQNIVKMDHSEFLHLMQTLDGCYLGDTE